MLIWVLIVSSVLFVVICGFAFRWLKQWADPDSRGERDLRKRLRDYLAEQNAAEDKISKLSKESRFSWWRENHDKD